MISTLQQIRSWGIRAETPAQEANSIQLTNIILLFMLIASIFETAVCFWSGAIQAALLNSTAPVVFGSGLLLMRSGRTRFARLLVLTISYFAAYGIATILGPEAEIQLIILLGSALTFFFFPLEATTFIFFGLSLPLGCYVALELTGFAPVLGFSRAELNPQQLLAIRSVTVAVVWFVLVLNSVYFIRSRKRAQAHQISSAKMIALGQMAAGIAHEVNNPLFVVVGHAGRLASMAENGPVPAEKASFIAKKIETTSMRIASIVHGLQSLTRDSSRDPYVEVPLKRLVDQTLDFCRARIESHGVLLKLPEIPETSSALGREAQLSEVLLNVLNNALDATLDQPERWIQISVNSDGDMLEVAVTDSGIGIPGPIRQRIFDPFFTTKPTGKGTGLGLSISRAIMSAHNGRIILDEKSAKTRFVIRVPKFQNA